MAKIPNFANIPFAGAEANEQAAQEWLTQLKAETGKSFDEIARDTERDNFMTAEEAKEYGLIDAVITKPQTKE